MPIKALGVFCAMYMLVFQATISLVLPSLLIWQEQNWFSRFAKVDEMVNKIMISKGMTNFFANHLNKAVLQFRGVIVFVFCLWFLGMIVVSAVQSDTMQYKDIYLPASNKLVQDFNILTTKFQSGGQKELQVEVTFGIDGYDPEFWGDDTVSYWQTLIGGPTFDIRFETTSINSQQAMLEFCQSLRGLQFVRRSSINCWIEKLNHFIVSKGETLPMKTARFEYYLQRWMLETNEGKVALARQHIVFAGEKLLVSKVTMDLKDVNQNDYKQVNAVRKEWDTFMLKWNRDKAPPGLKSVTLTAAITYPEMDTFNTFKVDTVPCIVISSCLCLCGLFILNRQHILIMTSTLFCIFCSLMTVIGITTLQGW